MDNVQKCVSCIVCNLNTRSKCIFFQLGRTRYALNYRHWIRNANLTDTKVPLIIQMISTELRTRAAVHAHQASSARKLRAAVRTEIIVPVPEIVVCAKLRNQKLSRKNQRNELRIVSLVTWIRLLIHINSRHFMEEKQEFGVKSQMPNEILNPVAEEFFECSLLKVLLFVIKSYETLWWNIFYFFWYIGNKTLFFEWKIPLIFLTQNTYIN